MKVQVRVGPDHAGLRRTPNGTASTNFIAQKPKSGHASVPVPSFSQSARAPPANAKVSVLPPPLVTEAQTPNVSFVASPVMADARQASLSTVPSKSAVLSAELGTRVAGNIRENCRGTASPLASARVGAASVVPSRLRSLTELRVDATQAFQPRASTNACASPILRRENGTVTRTRASSPGFEMATPPVPSDTPVRLRVLPPPVKTSSFPGPVGTKASIAHEQRNVGHVLGSGAVLPGRATSSVSSADALVVGMNGSENLNNSEPSISWVKPLQLGSPTMVPAAIPAAAYPVRQNTARASSAGPHDQHPERPLAMSSMRGPVMQTAPKAIRLSAHSPRMRSANCSTRLDSQASTSTGSPMITHRTIGYPASISCETAPRRIRLVQRPAGSLSPVRSTQSSISSLATLPPDSVNNDGSVAVRSLQGSINAATVQLSTAVSLLASGLSENSKRVPERQALTMTRLRSAPVNGQAVEEKSSCRSPSPRQSDLRDDRSITAPTRSPSSSPRRVHWSQQGSLASVEMDREVSRDNGQEKVSILMRPC